MSEYNDSREAFVDGLRADMPPAAGEDALERVKMRALSSQRASMESPLGQRSWRMAGGLAAVAAVIAVAALALAPGSPTDRASVQGSAVATRFAARQPAPVESGAAHSLFLSITETVAAGMVQTTTVEAAVASLPGVKLPSGPLAASPEYALTNQGRSGVGLPQIAVYYASGVMVNARPGENDLGALQAECGKASATNPFVDGKRHDEMLSTPIGEVLAIQGGWQRGAPRVTPSRVIFAIDGIGYTIESTSAEPIPVGQLVALAGTMR